MKLIFLLMFLVFGAFSTEENSNNRKWCNVCQSKDCEGQFCERCEYPPVDQRDRLIEIGMEPQKNPTSESYHLLKILQCKGNDFARIAAEDGHTGFFKLLALSGKIDLNQTEQFGKTLVWIAVEKGHIEIVKFLAFTGKVDLNRAEQSGKTPVWTAAERGHTEIVKFLAGKVDLNQADKSGKTPVRIAAEKGHEEIVEILIQKNVKLEQKLFEIANTKSIALLIISKMQSNFKEAVKNVRLEDVAGLLELLQEDVPGLTLAGIATLYGRTEILKFLHASTNVDLNQASGFQETLVYTAAEKGHIEIVKFLAGKVDLNQAEQTTGKTPVYIAAEKGHIEVVKFLAGKVDLNQADKYGKTPVSVAAERGHTKIVEFLNKRTLAEEFTFGMHVENSDSFICDLDRLFTDFQKKERENETKVSEIREKADNDLKEQKEYFLKLIDCKAEEMKNQREQIHAQIDATANCVWKNASYSIRKFLIYLSICSVVFVFPIVTDRLFSTNIEWYFEKQGYMKLLLVIVLLALLRTPIDIVEAAICSVWRRKFRGINNI